MITKINTKSDEDTSFTLYLRVLFLTIVLLLLPGCRKSADDVVESWKNLGIYLPDDEDVEYIESQLPHSLPSLRKGLEHENPHVRMCSAHVIGKLGEPAKSLGQALRESYIREQKAINRVYFAKALAAIGDTSSNNIGFLNRSFAIEEDIQVRTYLAGALLIISGVDTNSEAWKWIVNNLSTGVLTDDPNIYKDTEYWECRWGASYMLGRLGHKARQAVSLLERLKEDESAPDWVKSQIERDIATILGSKGSSSVMD